VNKLDLKKILKSLKLNESSISMILGIFIIIVVGLLVINYFKKTEKGTTVPAVQTEKEGEAVKNEKGELVYTVKKGDTVTIKTPAGPQKYFIVEIK